MRHLSPQVQESSATALVVPILHCQESPHRETEQTVTTPEETFAILEGLDSDEINAMVHTRNVQERDIALLMSLGVSIIAFGPPGTGKSTLGRVAARKLWKANAPKCEHKDNEHHTTACDPARFPEGFEGYTVFQASEDAIGTTILQRMAIRTNENGQTYSTYEDGPGLVAVKAGAVFIVEEIDESSVGLSAMLTPFAVRGMADDVTLADGSTVRHAPGYAMLGTMNGELDDLHRRLQDRLAPFRIACPSSAMLKALGPGLMKLCARMYYLAQQSGQDVGITYRQFELFRDARAAGMPDDRAALVACRADKSASDAFLGVVKLAEAPSGSAQKQRKS